MKAKTIIAEILCIFMVLAGTAWADDTVGDNEQADDSDVRNLDIRNLDKVVVVSDKTPRLMRDIVGSVTVIDQEQIESAYVQDVSDLFLYEPGVSVSSDPGRFGLTDYTIRGVTGNRVAVELDGIPIADRFSIGSFSDAGRDYIDPVILKRAEILRGPASTLYGSDALGGVVTYTTKDPNDFLGNRPVYMGVNAAYHSADESRLATLVTAGGNESLGAMLMVSRRDGNETDPGGSVDANPQDYDSTNVLLKTVLDTAGGQRWRFAADYANSNTETDVQSLVMGPGRFASTTGLWGDDESERLRFSVEQEFSFAGGTTGVWRGYTQDSEITQDTIQDRAAGGREPSPTRRERRFTYNYDSDGGEATFVTQLSTNKTSHRLVYGVEAEKTTITELRNGMQTNLDTGESTNIVIGETFPVRDFPKTETISAGAYLQDEITFDNYSFAIIPALRYDYYDLDPQPDALYLEDNPGTNAVGLHDKGLSPKLAALFPLSENWSAFAQYAHGFRAPPAEDVNIGFEIPIFNYKAIPNPDLDSETSDGVEFGFRYDGADLTFIGSAYYNEYEDFIESRVNLGLDANGTLLFQSQNRDEARIYGTEIHAVYAPSMLPGWSFEAALAWSRGDDTERDEPLNTVDPLNGYVALGWDSAARNWGARLALRAAAEKDRVDDSMVELFETPGYGVVDITGYYDIRRNVKLRWAVQNLADKKYWMWSDVSGLPADDPNLGLYAQPGLNASLNLSFSW